MKFIIQSLQTVLLLSNMKTSLVILCFSFVVFSACNQTPKKEKAEMYEASELASTMRQMVEFSKSAKAALANNQSIDSIPSEIWDMVKS